MRKIAVLPTLLTLGNAVCGFASIAIASCIKGETDANANLYYMFSAVLIFAAMIFDALDGYAARLARSVSDFGKELDSLCDAVSFGLAPAFLLLCIGQDWKNDRARQVIAVIAALYLVCTILRLARYNVETSPDPNAGKRFKGLPSPAAAGCVATLALLRSGYGLDINGFTDTKMLADFVATWAPLGTLFVALLMVSSVPFPHLIKHLSQRRRRHFGVVVQAVLIVFVIALTRGLALALLFWAYALAFPIRSLLVGRRRPEVPAEDQNIDWMDDGKMAER